MNTLRSLVVDGFQLKIREAGSGEPLLLLHGYPQDHRCWRHQFERLAQTHRVIAPDWFGWGESERSFAYRAEYAAEVGRIGLLADALALERFNLAGHDYGGFLGLGYALREPRRLLRLALINSRAHGSFTPAFYRQTALECWSARRPLARRLFAALPLYRMHRGPLRREVPRAFSEEELEGYIGWIRSAESRRWIVHFFRYYEVEARAELDAGLESLDLPLTVIWGERDPYCSAAVAHDLAARVRGAALTLLPDAGHFSPEESPEPVYQALRAWLARAA